jgi:hypothetical protein
MHPADLTLSVLNGLPNETVKLKRSGIPIFSKNYLNLRSCKNLNQNFLIFRSPNSVLNADSVGFIVHLPETNAQNRMPYPMILSADGAFKVLFACPVAIQTMVKHKRTTKPQMRCFSVFKFIKNSKKLRFSRCSRCSRCSSRCSRCSSRFSRRSSRCSRCSSRLQITNKN